MCLVVTEAEENKKGFHIFILYCTSKGKCSLRSQWHSCGWATCIKKASIFYVDLIILVRQYWRRFFWANLSQQCFVYIARIILHFQGKVILTYSNIYAFCVKWLGSSILQSLVQITFVTLPISFCHFIQIPNKPPAKTREIKY